MSTDTLTLYINPAGASHDTGRKHPECPDRLRALYDLFQTKPFSGLKQVKAGHGAMKAILRAHPQRYIAAVGPEVRP